MTSRKRVSGGRSHTNDTRYGPVVKDTTGEFSHDAARPRGGGVLLRVQLPATALASRGPANASVPVVVLPSPALLGVSSELRRGFGAIDEAEVRALPGGPSLNLTLHHVREHAGLARRLRDG